MHQSCLPKKVNRQCRRRIRCYLFGEMQQPGNRVLKSGSDLKANREKAEDLLDKLRSLMFILMMNFMLVYFAFMKELSLTLQRNDTTVDTVVDKIQAVKIKLQKLRVRKEQQTMDQGLEEKSNQDGSTIITYNGETVGVPSQQVRETRTAQSQRMTTKDIKQKVIGIAEQVLDDTLDNLDGRFNSFVTNNVIQAAAIVNPQNWPDDGDALDDYGEAEIGELYHHFRSPLESRHVVLESCKVQWMELKHFIARRRRLEKQVKTKKAPSNKRPSSASSFLHVHDMWSTILADPELVLRFSSVLSLIRIVLVLPVHTANLERGFSQMNIIMTDTRTNLTTSSISSLLMLKLSGIDYKDYDPTNAIVKWCPWSLPQNKRRRPHTKPYGPRPSKTVKFADHEAIAEATMEPKVTEVNENYSSESDSKSESDSNNSDSSAGSESGIGIHVPVPTIHRSTGGVGRVAKRTTYSSVSESDSDTDIKSTHCGSHTRAGGGLARLAREAAAEDSESAWDYSSEVEDSDF